MLYVGHVLSTLQLLLHDTRAVKFLVTHSNTVQREMSINRKFHQMISLQRTGLIDVDRDSSVTITTNTVRYSSYSYGFHEDRCDVKKTIDPYG